MVAALRLVPREPDDYFWEGEINDALITIEPLVRDTAVLGVTSAADDLERRWRVGVDWALVNRDAVEWARSHAAELVRGITGTTRSQVAALIAEWIESGEPLPALERNLRVQAGSERRARLIAATEVTNAFGEGNRIAWEESGVVDREEWRTVRDERVCPICGPLHGKQNKKVGGQFEGGYRPAAHPGCRCWTAPVVEGT